MSEFECRPCEGKGWIPFRRQIFAAGPTQVFEENCSDCNGHGWIECDRGGVECPYEHCYCEAAWDRQQEDNASEPPMTADERHQRAHDERQALRSGRPM